MALEGVTESGCIYITNQLRLQQPPANRRDEWREAAVTSQHSSASIRMCHSDSKPPQQLRASGQTSGNKMLMSVPMGTVTPGEPAMTFSQCRLMIRRADLSVAAAATAAAGGGGLTEKLQAGKKKTHQNDRQPATRSSASGTTNQ